MATTGLDVSRLVQVDVEITPQGAAVRNFSVLLIIGDSDVISGAERIRKYTSDILGQVGTQFGTSSPEYEAAVLYLNHTPQPAELLIGRWIREATEGFLDGGILTSAEQLMPNWTPILDGTFTISFDGVPEDATLLDFSLQTNLNGVASVITAGLTGGVVTWNGSRFIAESNSTGALSTVSYATPQGTGTDISAMLKLTLATADVPVVGFDPETAEEAYTALYDMSSEWYSSLFAATVMPTDADYIDIMAFVEPAIISRILFITDTDVRELDSVYLTSISTQLKDLLHTRSAVQYSQDPYAEASTAGLLAIFDPQGVDTSYTVMYKTQPGVTPEVISTSQADTLQEKRCNVYAEYSTNTAIIQYGVMSYSLYIDERQQFDWLQNAVQIAVFNLLSSVPKVGQTDSGVTSITTVIAAVFTQAVTNGMIAPGVWNGPSFGNVVTGQYLTSGYAIYAPPVSSQNQVDREARISVPIQCAVKLAGAIHTVDILININR